MRKASDCRKRLLWVQLFFFFLNGAYLQKIPSSQVGQKPQVYWATSVDSSNRGFQQPNEWNAINHPNDRKWQDSAPVYNYPAPPPPYVPPTPGPTTTTPEPTTTTPEPTTTTPAPTTTVYVPPPPPPPPVPDQAAYPPAFVTPSSYYDPRSPSYGYPPSPPVNPFLKKNKRPSYKDKYPHKGPTFLDLLEKDKQALDTIKDRCPDKLKKDQKVWLSALVPVIVLAVAVPVAAILVSGFTITTNKRSFPEVDVDSIKKSVMNLAEQYGSVLESEECMQRIICNLGSYATNIPGRSYLMMFLSSIGPDTMRNNIAIFQKAATYGAEKAHCDSFKCSAWKY